VIGTADGGQRPRTVAVLTADGTVVAREVAVADKFGSRLMGLMGRSKLHSEEGLWLVPCNSVQMFFMRTPLDIAYLDRQLRVVRCVPEMREWSARWWPVRHAYSALELAPGTLSRHRISEGDQLSMDAEPNLRTEVEAQMATTSPEQYSSNVRE